MSAEATALPSGKNLDDLHPGMYRHTEPTPVGVLHGLTTLEEKPGGRLVTSAFEDGQIYARWTPTNGQPVRFHHRLEHGWVVDGPEWSCTLCPKIRAIGGTS